MKEGEPFRERHKLHYDLENLVKRTSPWLREHKIGGQILLKRDPSTDINSVVKNLEEAARNSLGVKNSGSGASRE